MKRFWSRLRYWTHHRQRQQMLWEEMVFHIATMTEDLVAQGMPEQDARAAAYRKFGHMIKTSEDSRTVWIAQWISDAAQDLRHAFRGMRREAGFTAFVVLIAGLGIGASATVFSVVNALLLRPLPVRDPAHLVWIANQEWNMQVSQFLDLREQNKSFSDLAGIASNGNGPGDLELTGSGDPERLTSVAVTQNLFPLLGVQPMFGRSFSVEESRQRYRTPPVAILSYGFWQRRFGADRDVVGRKLMLNNKPVMVIGVLPASFDFASIFAPGTVVDLFLPWPLTDETNRFGNTLKGIGRLKPGATAESAQTEFTQLCAQLKEKYPDRNPVKPHLTALQQHVNGRVSPALMVLICAVAVVMLIVCANLSNLQLARLGARQKEMAVRSALGAGRLRLLRQMLTESIALSCCGAALGLLLAIAGTRAIAHLEAFDIPLLASVKLDGSALGFTLLAAVATGVLFGLLPALQVPSFAIGGALKDSGRGTSGQARGWVRNGLVVSEIAFACTLLVGAGLLMRSFVRVLDIDPGFRPEGVAALRVDPSFRFTGGLPQQNLFIDDMLHRMRALPGTRAAGLTEFLPLGGDRSWQVSARGVVYAKDDHPEAFMRVVSDGYFEAVGIRLFAGREFTESDRAGSEPVVIVNETAARTLWPGQDPIGQFVTQDNGRRVIGVVADVRHDSLERVGGLEMYRPMRQTGDYGAMNLVVRTTLPLDGLAAGVRTALRPLDPNLPVTEFKTLQGLVDKAMSPRRFLLMMLMGFAGFALLLASVGIYAVISYSVSQRVQEIGIRMALGASARDVERQILVQTLGLAAAGLALGMLASRALTTTLESLLFGVRPGDPVTFAVMAALLIAVAAFAGYFPARRASRIDPMVALRAS